MAQPVIMSNFIKSKPIIIGFSIMEIATVCLATTIYHLVYNATPVLSHYVRHVLRQQLVRNVNGAITFLIRPPAQPAVPSWPTASTALWMDSPAIIVSPASLSLVASADVLTATTTPQDHVSLAVALTRSAWNVISCLPSSSAWSARRDTMLLHPRAFLALTFTRPASTARVQESATSVILPITSI